MPREPYYPIDHPPITVTFKHERQSRPNPDPDGPDLLRYVDSIAYDPAVLWVKPGDRVQWTSNYNLKICFHRGTPLGSIRIRVHAGEYSAWETVLADAKPRGYHYNVHAALPEQVGGEWLIDGDPGCPELIVE